MEPGDIFDCDQLSGVVIQVKNTKEGDTDALKYLRPVGIIRDFKDPLPYLALLMELGTKFRHQGGRLIKHSWPKHAESFQYKVLKQEYQRALDDLSRYREQNPKDKKHLKDLEAAVQAKELEKDLYNGHSISARGAGSTTYGILKKAGIEKEFDTFLRIVMPQEPSYKAEIARIPSTHRPTGWPIMCHLSRVEM